MAGAIARWKASQWGYLSDFSVFWLAADALVRGADPYTAVSAGMAGFHFDSGFLYPLPAALIVAPLTALPVLMAGVLFVALSMGALAWALTRDGWQRWPILMSFPALWAVGSGQWSPLVTAAALSPSFAWAAACKPTLGVAAWVRRPSWTFLWIGLLPVSLSFILMPDWPLRWVEAAKGAPAGNYHIPLLRPGGVLLLAAALRWRHPDARLLLGMSVVPQTTLMYDFLPLGLLARTRTQAYVFAIWSYLAPWGAVWLARDRPAVTTTKAASLAFLADVAVWAFYLPLLAMVLRRRTNDDAR